MILSGKRYLLTCDDWFLAPNGLTYKYAYGTVIVRNFKDYFGYPAHHSHTNWFLEVGQKLSIPGCRLSQAIQTDEIPTPKRTNITLTPEGQLFYDNIYILE